MASNLMIKFGGRGGHFPKDSSKVFVPGAGISMSFSSTVTVYSVGGLSFGEVPVVDEVDQKQSVSVEASSLCAFVCAFSLVEMQRKR